MSQSIGKCLLPMLLKKRKWTQVDLEAATGIHRNQLSEYSNNKRTMSLKNARIMANALKCHTLTICMIGKYRHGDRDNFSLFTAL